MAKNRKIILSCAVTGAIHTPSMSDYLPCGVDGIVKAAVDAGNAGASMLHVHAREENGKPTADFATWRRILSGIKAGTDAVIGITTGGAVGLMTVQERLSVIAEFKPEIASCNAGSINFSLTGLTKLIETPKYDWELPFLEASYGKIFQNTFEDLEYAIRIMNEHGTKQEFEIFDLGQIGNLAYFVKQGIVPKPMFLQFVLGVMGGAPQSLDNLNHYISQAKRMLGDDVMYSLVIGGRMMFRYGIYNAISGGNCRVGMEDSLYINVSGELAKSNAEQVEKIIGMLRSLDFEVATPDEAREMLQLKGAANVGF